MASLQARHQRDCSLVTARIPKAGRSPSQWTTFADATKQAGCSCTPLYHVVLRHGGKLVREPVGHNRKEAERALDARRGDVARRRYHVVKDISFREWGDQWLAAFTGKPSSRRVYGHTIAYATATFGGVKVRELTTSDVDRFLTTVRRANEDRGPAEPGEPAREVSQATLAKHTRQLGACLQGAVAAGYAEQNPVRLMHKSTRPRLVKKAPSYLTDAELAALWPALADRPLMLALIKTAVGTGARLGELSALTWDDVDLLARELHIGRTYSEGFGETTPKSGERRTVDLTPPAAKVLEDWLAEDGDNGRVFALETGGYIASRHADRALYGAMARAGIPRVGERGGKRTFHSLRNTFARVALEGGAPIDWVRRQLGHSTIALTVEVYGEWSRSAQKAEAAKLAKAFKL
jgi:integrase